jgi:hypothetical protein
MHPLFGMYHDKAPLWCKQLIEGALAMLLPEPALTVQGPSTLLATINEQPAQNRKVVHLLHYVPERKAKEFDIIEDIIPLYNLPVSVKAEGASKVYLAPQGTELAFEAKDGRVQFVVEKLEGHQIVVVE